MRILVTGGCGFIGRAVVRSLMRTETVLVVDALRHGDPRFTTDELRMFELIRSDIRDYDSLKSIAKRFKPDVVIHLAAIHYIPECELFPDEAVSVNVGGTVNIGRVCQEHVHVIFMSTAAVYAPSPLPHRETSDLGPVDVYGLTKLHAEDYLDLFRRQQGFRTTVIRLFNVIGPGETNPHIAPEILQQVKRGNMELRLGNVQSVRDYVHVDDVVEILRTIADSPSESSHQSVVVNVGTGAGHTVIDLVTQFSIVTQMNLRILVDPKRVRKMDRPSLIAHIGEVERLFSWTPTLTMENAIEDLWNRGDLHPSLEEREGPT